MYFEYDYMGSRFAERLFPDGENLFRRGAFALPDCRNIVLLFEKNDRSCER